MAWAPYLDADTAGRDRAFVEIAALLLSSLREQREANAKLCEQLKLLNARVLGAFLFEAAGGQH